MGFGLEDVFGRPLNFLPRYMGSPKPSWHTLTFVVPSTTTHSDMKLNHESKA